MLTPCGDDCPFGHSVPAGPAHTAPRCPQWGKELRLRGQADLSWDLALLWTSCRQGPVDVTSLRRHSLSRKLGRTAAASQETEAKNVAVSVVARRWPSVLSLGSLGGISVTGAPALYDGPFPLASSGKLSLDTCLLSHLGPKGPRGASREVLGPGCLCPPPPPPIHAGFCPPPDYETTPLRALVASLPKALGTCCLYHT